VAPDERRVHVAVFTAERGAWTHNSRHPSIVVSEALVGAHGASSEFSAKPTRVSCRYHAAPLDDVTRR
jgi:hypothetical protein